MVQITILCDNVVGTPVGIGEHGFSALLELDDKTILFDTGAGRGILSNAMALGKDLRLVKEIFVSHGHYDHTEGLPQVLGVTRGADVYAHPGIFDRRIAEIRIGERIIRRFIGSPHLREHLEFLGARFHLEKGFREISEGIFLTGEVPRRTAFEQGDPNLFLIHGDSKVADPILDDQSLVLRMEDGLVIIFGCAHAGMINTIHYARETLGEERIRAVLGGTHLGFLSEEQLFESIAALRDMEPQLVAVSHCTGLKAACRLMAEFEDRFAFAHVGSVFRFE